MVPANASRPAAVDLHTAPAVGSPTGRPSRNWRTNFSQTRTHLECDGLRVARRAAPPSPHFGYIATGVEDHRTVPWNHGVFSLSEIRARPRVDVNNVDVSVQLFGARLGNAHVPVKA
jgi:hypothetical protein